MSLQGLSLLDTSQSTQFIALKGVSLVSSVESKHIRAGGILGPSSAVSDDVHYCSSDRLHVRPRNRNGEEIVSRVPAASLGLRQEVSLAQMAPSRLWAKASAMTADQQNNNRALLSCLSSTSASSRKSAAGPPMPRMNPEGFVVEATRWPGVVAFAVWYRKP